MTYRFFLFLLLVAFCTAPTFSQWSTPVPITAINDPSAEDWSPFITTDGLTLYFVRVRSPLSYYGKICAATRKDIDKPFTSPRVLDCPLNNSPGHQLCPWVSCDNLRMYYHNENGIWRIMLSERTSVDEPWPAGKSVEELNVLGNKLQAPSLTEDELTIFFNAYDIPGGKGNYDLWMATRTDRHSSFTNYRNLSEINTEFGDLASFISPSRDNSNEQFKTVQALTQFDVPGKRTAQPCLSYNGREMYFMLSNESDRSTRDIYVSYYSKGDSYYINSSNTEPF